MYSTNIICPLTGEMQMVEKNPERIQSHKRWNINGSEEKCSDKRNTFTEVVRGLEQVPGNDRIYPEVHPKVSGVDF